MEELALPTKESIRSAAEKCPEAKEVLKELFPKVFEDDCDYNRIEVDRILGDIRRYVKGDDEGFDHSRNRTRYFTARLLFHCLYSSVVDEIEKQGPRKFYEKWKDADLSFGE